MNLKLTKDKLHTKCEEVAPGENISGLIMGMQAVMKMYGGIGLAANQIGSNKRVIVVHCNGFREVFVNPVITKKYGGTTTSKEGCLSFPAKQVVLSRHKQIIVEGVTHSGRPLKRKLKGMPAIVVQHEVDHLDGITMFDRLEMQS